MRPLEIILIAGSIALFFAVNAKDGPASNTWSIGRGSDATGVRWEVDRRHGNSHWRSSNTVPWSRFKGLTLDDLNRGGALKFEYVGEAGSLLCEGKTQLVRGASGPFTFRPNPAFGDELVKLGYTGRATEDELFNFAMHGVSLELARALAEGPGPASPRDLEKLAIHGIDAVYLRDVRAAGYAKLTAEDFVQARIHGVEPRFLTAIKGAGYDLDMDRMVELRIHGVSIDYLNELRDNGLKPDARELVQLKIHGVSAALLKAMADSGYRVSDAGDAVELKIHGVSPDFIRDVKALGYQLPARELVQFRIHGVDAAYLKRLAGSGYANLTPEKIVKLKIHGVD